MIVDCDRCVVRGDACQDCVVTVLLGAPPGGVELDGIEATALENLAAAGMVPRLQLVNREQRHSGAATAELGEPGEAAAFDQRPVNCDERSARRVS